MTEQGTAAGDYRVMQLLVEEHERQRRPRLERLWRYYRNEMQGGDGGQRDYRLSQEDGLPCRLRAGGLSAAQGGIQREVVVENDIAWRVHTLVDFMFGRPFALQSWANNEAKGREIESFLKFVFEANGGMGFFQDLALIGSVYGYVDVIVRVSGAVGGAPVKNGRGESQGGRGAPPTPGTWAGHGGLSAAHRERRLLAAAKGFVLEIVEPTKAVPVVNEGDYRRLDAYMLHYEQELNAVEEESGWRRFGRRLAGRSPVPARRARVQRTQVWTPAEWLEFDGLPGDELLAREVNVLGRVPVVHIQNLSQPFFYEGLSEVEPLIPLQDELNTRLSDRANRVTFQSFKMYLGKGIEKFIERPVGPGQMWATDNPEATIEEFGGDAASPSEEAHINEIRDAMDKTSGVTPIAAGLLRNKVGNLTSENALRIVLLGLLAKTERKRVTYGAGIERLCELVLEAADVLGVLDNQPEDRVVRIDWPSPLPENESERLRDAKLKLELGIPVQQVLTELGYGNA